MQQIKEYVTYKKIALAKKIKTLTKKLKATPKLVIIQVGEIESSTRYVKGKLADCAEIGLPCELISVPESISETDLLKQIRLLNKDNTVSGIIVQLPLPSHINEEKVFDTITAKKDVDGFTRNSLVNPATPQGILTYLEDNDFKFENANAVVIGRSRIVGKPMARLLLDKNCNVTVLHSKTSPQNVLSAMTNADLVVVAAGKRNTITDFDASVTHKNCLIIDVGINFKPDGKMCGDAESITLRDRTPVPGGVGLLTRYALLENTVKVFENNQ